MARERPTYQERIIQNPNVMVGKPVVKGTRIPVEKVLDQLAHKPDLKELFEIFPELTVEDVKACLAYAQAAVASKGGHPGLLRLAGPAPRPRIPPERAGADAVHHIAGGTAGGAAAPVGAEFGDSRERIRRLASPQKVERTILVSALSQGIPLNFPSTTPIKERALQRK